MTAVTSQLRPGGSAARGAVRRRRSLALSAWAGILGPGLFTAAFLIQEPDDAPLHQWVGLVQRALILVVVFPCRVVLSLRLQRVARVS